MKDEEEIRTISSYNNGEVLILSQSRLYKIGKRSRLKDIKIPSNSDFHGMVFDSKGNIWIAGRAGISKYDFKSWTNYNEDNSGLTDNYILSITIDNYDNIWIGTEKGGVCVFNENGIKIMNNGNEKIIIKSLVLLYLLMLATCVSVLGQEVKKNPQEMKKRIQKKNQREYRKFHKLEKL